MSNGFPTPFYRFLLLAVEYIYVCMQFLINGPPISFGDAYKDILLLQGSGVVDRCAMLKQDILQCVFKFTGKRKLSLQVLI